MRKLFVLLVVAALAAAGGWYVGQEYGIAPLEGTPLEQAFQKDANPKQEPQKIDLSKPPLTRKVDTIRIATLHIPDIGTGRTQNTEVLKTFAKIVRRFDVLAIQGVRSQEESVVEQVAQLASSDGRRFRHVVSGRARSDVEQTQFAFVFDSGSVEIDRTKSYVVRDPDALLQRDPFVARFRVRGPQSREAFTFSLVNVDVSPHVTESELDVLDDVYWAVRNDGADEDDVIVLGNFNTDHQQLGQLESITDMAWIVGGDALPAPPRTLGTVQSANIFFHRTATAEHTGRGGVFDFMSQYELSIQQALTVSDHLPVWAEFRVREDFGSDSASASRATLDRRALR